MSQSSPANSRSATLGSGSLRRRCWAMVLTVAKIAGAIHTAAPSIHGRQRRRKGTPRRYPIVPAGAIRLPFASPKQPLTYHVLHCRPSRSKVGHSTDYLREPTNENELAGHVLRSRSVHHE